MRVLAGFVFPLALVALSGLSACSRQPGTPLHLGALPQNLKVALSLRGMEARSPMYIRVFKEEAELEVWKRKKDGKYHLFTSYPVCRWSGKIGPKLRERDRQTPEGFYQVSWRQMNPHSSYHLAFNLGFPNQFDRALGRTGSNIMIHGGCKSAGCYAMTNEFVEELYLLARDALKAGQKSIPVHAFPFRMTKAIWRLTKIRNGMTSGRI